MCIWCNTPVRGNQVHWEGLIVDILIAEPGLARQLKLWAITKALRWRLLTKVVAKFMSYDCKLLACENLKTLENCYQSFQMSSLLMVSQLHHLVTKFVTISSLSLAPLSLPKLGDWIQTSWRSPRKSSSPWRRQVLSDGQLLPGPVLSTW